MGSVDPRGQVKSQGKADRESAGVDRFDTGDGRRVYRLPLEVFPHFWGNAYLVTGGERPLLVDCGSGTGTSRRDLEAGLATVAERFDESVAWNDLGAVVLTHGHIDHFGGLKHLRAQTDAPIGIHVLDRRVVDGYRVRVAVASRHLELFFRSAGVEGERLARYMASYRQTKALFDDPGEHALIDWVFDEGPIHDGVEAIHVPGHCPGMVCLRLGDVLLTADQVLPRITPHLSPESITRHMGLAHYLASLDRIEALEGVRLGLGGHGGPIDDVSGRCRAIRRHCLERTERVLELCTTPRSILELSRELFGRVRSYHVLLAILETGTYVEYLDQRGALRADNVDALEAGDSTILYRST
ncbi:MAG: MBL fold metallo-hydrolase [Acidobacteriota bacterium]